MGGSTGFDNLEIRETVSLGGVPFNALDLAVLLLLIKGNANQRAAMKGEISQFLTLSNVTMPVVGARMDALVYEGYVVPANRQAIVLNYGGYNPTGAAINLALRIKRADGSYRYVVPTLNVNANSGNGTSFTFLLNAGESPSLEASAVGMNAGVKIQEFDALPGLLRPEVDLVAGDNLLYQVPNGKVAVIPSASFPSFLMTGSPQIVCSNRSGAAVTFVPHVLTALEVASSAATRAGAGSANLANLQAQTIGTSMPRQVFDQGEKLVVNVSAGGPNMWAYTTIYLMNR